MSDRWWFIEGGEFVYAGDRHTGPVYEIPAAAIEAIRKEALKEAADRAVAYMEFDESCDGPLRAAIMGENE